MSQQKNQQNSPPENLPQTTTSATGSNPGSDQFPGFPLQLQQNTSQNQQANQQRTQQPYLQQTQTQRPPLPPLPQVQGSQVNTTSQQQPITTQTSQTQSTPVQTVQTPNIRPTTTNMRGGAKKKTGTGGKKASTGTRPKPITTEKNEDVMLVQSLGKMANVYYQYGQNTPEGQKAYKMYIDTVQALEQRNNQLGNISFTPLANKQISSPASTNFPHKIPRMVSSTISIGPSSSSLTSQPPPSTPQTHVAPPPQQLQQQPQQQQQQTGQQQQVRVIMPQEYHNIQNVQQLKAEMLRINNLLQQDNLAPTSRSDLSNRLNILNQMSAKFGSITATGSNTGSIQQPSQHISPQSPYNSPRGYLGPQVARSPIQNSSPRMLAINPIGQAGMGSPSG